MLGEPLTTMIMYLCALAPLLAGGAGGENPKFGIVELAGIWSEFC